MKIHVFKLFKLRTFKKLSFMIRKRISNEQKPQILVVHAEALI